MKQIKIDADLLDKAILFAAEKHKGIRRKGDGTPYISHPFAVMMILFGLKNSKNKYLLAIAAILHDVVEDCGVTIAEIAELFGYKVAALVEELTTDDELCEKMGKTAYLSEKCATMTSYALRLKLADRLHNCTRIWRMPKKFRDNYIPQTVAIIHYIEENRENITKSHKILIRRIKGQIKLALAYEGSRKSVPQA